MNKKVKGRLVDDDTRCVHYHSRLDIIAIKFKCCSTYYPCYDCHNELAEHEAQQWPKSEWNEKAVLCGKCNYKLSINEYLACDNTCPNCQADFNPNCRLHYHLYFEQE